MTPLQLFIPALGTELELAKPWQFWLYAEARNLSLFEALGEAPKGGTRWNLNWGDRALNPLQVELAAGTLLVLDRIYIRQGNEDFDSVTFKLKHSPVPLGPMGRPTKKTLRFWAKLEDVNRIQVVPTASTTPQPLQSKPYISDADIQALASKVGVDEHRVRYTVERYGSLEAAERVLWP